MGQSIQDPALVRFKAAVFGGQTPDLREPLRKAYTPDEVKAVSSLSDGSPVERSVRFVVSTGSIDRDRDSVDPKGWDLTNYRKTPRVLWAHDYSTPPIGRALEIGVKDGRLISVAEFTPPDLYPFGDLIYRMIKADFLNSTSVGFRPVEWLPNDVRKGVDFKRQELMEYSVVTIPSNPDALMEAKAAGLDLSPMVAWAEQVLDETSGTPQIRVERALRIAKGEPVSVTVDGWRGEVDGYRVAVLPIPTKAVASDEVPAHAAIDGKCGLPAGETDPAKCTRGDCPHKKAPAAAKPTAGTKPGAVAYRGCGAFENATVSVSGQPVHKVPSTEAKHVTGECGLPAGETDPLMCLRGDCPHKGFKGCAAAVQKTAATDEVVLELQDDDEVDEAEEISLESVQAALKAITPGLTEQIRGGLQQMTNDMRLQLTGRVD